MKQWERDMRARLWEQLPDEEQEVKIDSAVYTVSKNTYIGFQVAVEKEGRRQYKSGWIQNKAI